MERATLWTARCWSMLIWPGSCSRPKMTKTLTHWRTFAVTSVHWWPISFRMSQVCLWLPYISQFKTHQLRWMSKVGVIKVSCILISLLVVFSAPEEDHLPPAVAETQSVHAVQSLGRTFQHHVHSPGPLQWQKYADQPPSVLCTEGTHKHKWRCKCWSLFSGNNSV